MVERRNTFPRTHRLSGRKAFGLVFEAKVRTTHGPLLIYGLPNELGHPRLGLTVSRRVGNAVTRNAIKRRLREAYRHTRHDLPTLDLVVVVRPHKTLKPDAYAELLTIAAEKLRAKWTKRLSGA